MLLMACRNGVYTTFVADTENRDYMNFYRFVQSLYSTRF